MLLPCTAHGNVSFARQESKSDQELPSAPIANEWAQLNLERNFQAELELAIA
jgi:hypothetical protein